MEILNNFKCDLNAEMLMKKLKISEGSEDELEFKHLVNTALDIANPKAVYLEGFIKTKGDDFVIINGVKFTSATLRKNLQDIERVFVYIATCGVELDSVKFSHNDFLKEYWWDIIKNHFLEIARSNLIEYIKKRYMLTKTAIMVPGGGEAGIWDISQQKQLFSLFGNVEKLIGVRLTETCLMIPNKSVSGILFPTEKDYHGCKLCRRHNCPGRKAEFDEQLWNALGIETNLKR
ncbi:MAG TPA: vitamin B12 dependent-methionine synthase activation domain-containing protein [bacterium]|nr:vitamin B12 dependent-methionine synthase activation domain-containing protein [bacterium]